jgi:uncharacterized protein YyaL (SSP411 family)
MLARARRTLLAVRARRPRPHLDDKVLTAWNGLMIAASARAARVLGMDAGEAAPASGEAAVAATAGRPLEMARRAARFVRARLFDEGTGTLLRRYRGGEAAVPGYAEDYAFLIFGLLELLQADGDAAWLDWALRLQRTQDALFWDEAGGGWFSTTGNDRSVLLRLKEDYDGAEPAASSVSVLNLLTLAHLTGDETLRGRIERTFSRFASRAAQIGRAMPMMLAGLSAYHSGVPQLVVTGADAGAAGLLDAVRGCYLPTAIVLRVREDARDEWARLLPWLGPMVPRDGRATAYLCRDFVCGVPLETADAIRESLSALRPAR